jgi:ribosomal-protein-alanine N-acetyltransferase
MVYLELAEEGDLAALAALERRSYTHPWSPRNFRDAWAKPKQITILLLRAAWSAADEDRGIRAYCVFEAVADEMHLHNLAVHPEYRRKGLGRRLLRLALWLAARRGARTAFLEVRQSNWAALGLYRHMGFEAVSVRRDYYTSPREDAMVLRLSTLGAEAAAGNP